MKRKIMFPLLAMAMLMVFANCTSQRDKDLDAIHKYEGTIDFATTKVDIPTGETLVKMYVAFANNYPTDSLAPMYLMKAADVAAENLIQVSGFVFHSYSNRTRS